MTHPHAPQGHNAPHGAPGGGAIASKCGGGLACAQRALGCFPKKERSTYQRVVKKFGQGISQTKNLNIEKWKNQ